METHERRKNMITLQRETFGDFIWRLLAQIMPICTIAFLFVVCLITRIGNHEIASLERELGVTDEILVVPERISVEEAFDRYIDTLPIPERTIERFVSIHEEEILMARENVAVQEMVLKETSNTKLAMQVSGMEPTVRVMNTTAYCSCEQCCDKTDGITATGEKTTEWCTVAAGPQYKFGTIIYIPSLKDKPNAGWFIVQDRGGAISNDKLDIYFDTHEKALQYGRKNQECYIFEF